MDTLLYVSLSIAMLLVIWFKTDAFLEYGRLLPLFVQRWFHIDEYDMVSGTRGVGDPSWSYHIFLLEYHSCWLVSLITCPICVSVWLGLFAIPLFPWPFAASFGGLFLYLAVGKMGI